MFFQTKIIASKQIHSYADEYCMKKTAEFKTAADDGLAVFFNDLPAKISFVAIEPRPLSRPHIL